MEENKEIDAGAVTGASVASEQSGSPKIDAPSAFRKNGRNGGHKQIAKKAEVASGSCGEITGFSGFSEKLSGSNVNGYGDRQFDKHSEKKQVEEKTESSTKTVSTPANETKLNTESHEGPHFEVSESHTTAIETPLVDKRAGKSDNKCESGVVSYSAESAVTEQKVSLLSRIKSMISSLFGKKAETQKKYRRPYDKNRRGGKNWKGGERRFNNDRRSYHSRGGYNNGGRKPYHNDRRPDGGFKGGKQNGGGSAPQA